MGRAASRRSSSVLSRSSRASTITRAIRSWNVNTSSTVPSNVSAHTWSSVLASMSCAVMRSRLRITAQLIDASTDDHVWADTFDGTVDDVFTFQERMARVIVDALELRLSTDEERRLAARPIGNVHAYECYLRARQEGWRWRKDAIDHAVQLLHNGLAIVGDNAGLYAALGLAHLQYRDAGIDVGERPLDEAEA